MLNRRLVTVSKKMFFFSLLLYGCLSANAQASHDDIMNDLHCTRAHYSTYPVPEKNSIEVPKGYKAVYLSHYGRHGSRYHADIDYYRDSYQFLMEEGEEKDNLTESGKTLLSKISVMYHDAIGREGGLTVQGVSEHRGIAERMFESYPDIFRDGSKIICRSTQSPRCILSMAANNECLKELEPGLDLVRTAYDHDGDLLRNDQYLVPLRKGISQIRRDYLMETGLDSESFVSRFFKETKKDKDLSLSFMLDVYGVYQMTGGAAHLAVSMDDIFTSDELFLLWKGQNWRNYLQCGNSPLYGDGILADSKVLLSDIVECADKALSGNGISADLRFGHDIALAPLLALIDLNGLGVRIDNPDMLPEKWADFKVMPMGANLQIVFYRHKKTADVLVILFHNEKEASLPLKTDIYPFYHWNDVRAYFMSLAGAAVSDKTSVTSIMCNDNEKCIGEVSEFDVFIK